MKKSLLPLTLLTISLLAGCSKSSGENSNTTGSDTTSTSLPTTTGDETSSTTEPQCDHNYSDWEIFEKPTLEKEGKAKKICSICGYENIVTIPNLSDTSTWTKETYDEATCEYEGMDEYSSIYGKVYVSTPKGEHKVGDRFYLKDDLINFYTLQTKCSVCNQFYGEQYKVIKPSNMTMLPSEGYTFEYDNESRRYVSTNIKVDSSSAILKIKMAVSGTFKFRYTVNSETNCDKFYAIKNDSGIMGCYGLSGKQNSGDDPISISVEYGDVITFKYEKDASGIADSTDTVELWDFAMESSESIHLSAVTFDSNGGTPVDPSITVNGKLFFDVPTINKEGYYFTGWYEDENCVVPVSYEKPLLDNAIIYAGWISEDDAFPLMGTYRGFSFRGGNNDHGNLSMYGGQELSIDFNANTSGLFDGQIAYNPTSKEVSCGYGHIEYDEAINGFIIYQTETLENTSEVYILMKNAPTITASSLSGLYWSAGMYKSISFPQSNGVSSLTLQYETNKFMWNTSLVGIDKNPITPGEANSAIGFSLLTKKGNSLGYFANDGTKIVGENECDGFQGYYTHEDGHTLMVNGAGSMKEYDAALEKSYSYNYTYKDGKIYNNSVLYPFAYVLNKENMTYSRAVPTVQVHLNMMGVTEDIVVDAVSGTWLDLPVPDTKDWAFDGWYEDEALTIKIGSRYKVPGESTLYAKWVVKHAVTLHRNNGEGNYVIMVKDGTHPDFPTFEYEDHLFMGWFKDVELENPFDELETITHDMDLYGYWIVEPKFYGEFKGLWLSTNFGLISDGSLSTEQDQATCISITKDGKYTNKDTSTTYYNGKFDPSVLPNEDGHLVFNNCVTTTVTASSGNTYLLGGFTQFDETDFVPCGIRLFAKTEGTFSFEYASSANEYVFIKASVNGHEDFLFTDSQQNVFVADPVFKDEDDTILSIADITKASCVKVYSSTGTLIETLVKSGNTFDESDMYRGNYTANLFGEECTVFVDGVDRITITTSTTKYNGTYLRYGENRLKLTYNGRSCFVDVSETTLTQELDGYQGTYTGSLGDLVLTGWGDATLNGETVTYTMSEGYVTLVTSSGEVTYGIDLANNTYDTGAELSIFSGLVFSGTNIDNYGDSEPFFIEFDNGANISGTVYYSVFHTNNFKTDFTGEYDESTHTLVITLLQDIYGSALAGKTITLQVETGKLTVLASDRSGPYEIYRIQVGMVLTCPGFVL